MSDSEDKIITKNDLEAVNAIENKDCDNEASSLQILNEFKNLYEDKIRNIDPNDANKSEIKMKIMTEWIKDLDAQNTMLVRTIEELEEAACCRVKILEEKLKNTSCVLTENMIHYTQPFHENLNELSNRITQLEKDERNLQRKIKYLQSDIRGLLELIRRAGTEKCWRLDGLQFFEILTSDIPIPAANPDEQTVDGDEKIEFLMQRLQSLDGNEKKSLEYQFQLQQKVNHLNRKLQINDDIMQKFISKFDHLQNKLKNQSSNDLDDIVRILDSIKSELLEKNVRNKEAIDHNSAPVLESNIQVSKLKNELVENQTEIIQLTNKINILEKESQESREVLTQEVAEKHDIIITLKDKVISLEEQLRQAKIQLQFKVDIIKEMRKKMISSATLPNTPQKTYINSNALSQKVSWSDDLSDEESEKTEELHHQHSEHDDLTTDEKMSKLIEISKQQFNSMEEFRICTVEAQAATEDLQEEINNVTSSLNSQQQLFVNLNKYFGKMYEIIVKTKDNFSNVMKKFKIQIEENAVSKNTISLREDKLKDIKNEINQARAKMSSLTIHDETHSSNTSTTEIETCDRLLNRLIDEVDYIICNLGIHISKEGYTFSIFNEICEQLTSIERNLEELQRHANQVLQENEATQKVLIEKSKRLDKLENELDYAHTKMQDALENIIFLNQQKESNDDHHPVNIIQTSTEKYNEDLRWNAELEQLKSTLSSKDKLLEHKDEIIRIQKDSISMTQGEVTDLQSKIDAQAIIIDQYVDDRNNLLEQNLLQKETIRHLQNAIVQAKKSVNRQQPQKSGIDLTVSDVWSPITPAVFNNDDKKSQVMKKQEKIECEHSTCRAFSFAIGYEQSIRLKQAETIKFLNKKIFEHKKLVDNCSVILENAKKMIMNFYNELDLLKKMLKEQSTKTAILETEYQLIKNDCSIISDENKKFELKRRIKIIMMNEILIK